MGSVASAAADTDERKPLIPKYLGKSTSPKGNFGIIHPIVGVKQERDQLAIIRKSLAGKLYKSYNNVYRFDAVIRQIVTAEGHVTGRSMVADRLNNCSGVKHVECQIESQYRTGWK